MCKALVDDEVDLATLVELTANNRRSLRQDNPMQATQNETTTKAFGNTSSGNVRVKAESEKYCSKKSIATHVRTGEAITTDRGKPAETASQLEKAKTGVLMKFHAARSGLGIMAPMSEHEKGLLSEMFEHDTWSGYLPGEGFRAGVSGVQVKALLSDSSSGGIEMNPEWFDEMAVTFPLLNGELFPYVTVVDVPRGSAVEAASIGNPTVSWGTASGTEAPLFDTDSLVAGIDTTIFPVNCVLEIGRDLMADSALNIGEIIVQNINQRLAAEWDKVIAVGNGTSQPQGIFNASGVTTVNSAGGAGAAAQVTDYESLLFAVGKQYRSAQYKGCFIANDTTYKRARSIAVGASDARRVFGMDHQSYQLLEYPYRIAQDVPNAKIAFCALAKYRLYRRQATETTWVNGDFSLARANKVGLIVRARMGGKLMDASAMAKITDAQS